MRKVAVVGIGETRFSGPQPKTQVELFAEAATEAIHSSNLRPKDIQALFVGNVLGDFAEGQGMVQSFAAEDIGCHHIPASRFEGACASSSIAFRDAFMWVASGVYDVVLVGGVERAASMGTPLATRTFAMFSDSRYEYSCGITFPAIFALLAHLYSHKYGIPLKKLKEQMAIASVQAYKYGILNPKAHLRKAVTKEQVLASAMVCPPLQLHDCCPFSDGGAAVVLAAEELAKSLTNKPVYVAGAGQAAAGPLCSQKDDLPQLKARALSAQRAYRMAGIKPSDVDVAEIHDCFSIANFIAAEGLGFFENGKAGDAWERGDADIGGQVAINLSGGLKSKGHPVGATGAGQVYEIVRQLRCEAEPERQAPEPRIGLTDTMGGGGGSLCTIILERGW